ncbi:biotin--[acetyl-CoA-carboxylase] ligase [Segnochrobactraceae bacterium EtOH-i3]
MTRLVLGPAAHAAGTTADWVAEIGSTSTEARERLRSGLSGPLWIVTDRQTGGRGRRGRAWTAPVGNLAASLGLRLAVPPAMAATFGFVASLAARDGVLAAAGDAGLPPPAQLSLSRGLRVKWPNDVLLDGAKLSGILLEAEPGPDGTLDLVVGIGINVVAAPEGLPYRAASLAGLGLHARAVFRGLADEMAGLVALWDNGRGFAAVRQRWLEAAAGLGRPVSVVIGASVREGIFRTIDADGRLILEGPDGGTQAIAAGEVHFGAARTGTATEG